MPIISQHNFQFKCLTKFRLNERILVRNYKQFSWQLKRFMSILNTANTIKCKTTDEFTYKYCIPFEGNEDLLFKITEGEEGNLNPTENNRPYVGEY